MKSSTQKLIIFQAGIISLCDNEILSYNNNSNNEISRETNLGEVYERLEKIENYLRAGNGINRMQNVAQKKNTVTNTKTNNINEISGIGKNKKPAQYWNTVVDNFKQTGKIMIYTNLLETNAVEINDMTIGIEFPKGMTAFGKTVLENPENKTEISKQVSIACGKTMQIKYIDIKSQENTDVSEENELSNFANEFDIPFNVIE